MKPTKLDPQRCAELFELPKDQCYLLAHSVGCLPKGTRNALQSKITDVWGQDPAQAWPQWMQVLGQFRSALASVLGGEAEQYCPQVNVSSGFSKVLGAAWPTKKNKRLLLSEADFPSLGFVAQCAQRQGWTLEWLTKDQDLCNPQVWSDAMHADIDAVLATHVQYSTNRRAPVSQICLRAKEQNILSIVDICQSAGIVPIDLPTMGADIALGSCIKWFCGGPGAGFLWVAPSKIDALEPVDVGWFSHEDPFEFEIQDFRYAHNADRFSGGTPSIMPFVSATVGIETMARLGSDAIYAHNQTLTQVLRNAVPPELLLSDEDPSKRGGTTVIDLPPEHPKVLALREHKVAFDARKFGIRLSPHVYTQRADIEKVAAILRGP